MGPYQKSIKTKVMVAGDNLERQADLQFPVGTVEMVKKFKYLGPVVHCNGGVDEDITQHIAKASQTFGRVRKSVFGTGHYQSPPNTPCLKQLSLHGTVLHCSEAWATKCINTNKLKIFHNSCLRGMFGITCDKQRDEKYYVIKDTRNVWDE